MVSRALICYLVRRVVVLGLWRFIGQVMEELWFIDEIVGVHSRLLYFIKVFNQRRKRAFYMSREGRCIEIFPFSCDGGQWVVGNDASSSIGIQQ